MRSKYKIIACIGLLLVIPVFLGSVVINILVSNYNRSEKFIQSERLVSQISSNISDELDKMVYVGKSVSADDGVKAYLSGNAGWEDSTAKLLLGLVDADENLVELALYDSDGNLLPASTGYADGIYEEVGSEYFKSMAAQGYGFSNIVIDPLTNYSGEMIKCVVSIYHEGVVVGYCEEYFGLKPFKNLITSVSNSGEYEVIISDRNGNLIMHPFDSMIPIDREENLVGAKENIQKALNNWKTVKAEYKTADETMYLFGSGVSTTKNTKGKTWGVFLTINKEKFETGLGDFNKKANAARIIIFLVSYGLFIFVTLKFLKPLDAIYNLFLKFNAGDKKSRFAAEGRSDVVRIGNSVNYLLDEIEESELRYNTLVEMMDNIIFEYDLLKDSIVFSDNFNAKFSFRAKSLKFEDSFFIHGAVPRKEKAEFENFVARLTEEGSVQGEFSFQTIYGDYAWYIVRSTAIKESSGKIVKIMGVMIDIDRAKRREENLLKKANYDALTKVFNRATFEINLANEYDLSQMRKTRIAVLFIDLDDFKHFNDNYGHALGDEVLEFVAATVKELVGNNGFAGRYGGDEFVVCYGENGSLPEAGELAEAIIVTLNDGFEGKSVQGHFEVNCSIGISYYNEHSIDADSVIKNADEAMYSVKKNGKSDYAYYSKLRR